MSSKKHPLGEKRNHPGSKLRQGFWMVFRLGVNNWGYNILVHEKETIQGYSVLSNCGLYSSKISSNHVSFHLQPQNSVLSSLQLAS
ncbi:hypothetical protein EQH22_09635 [Streptococcus pneumoniae]|nr:hypothetical protein EQH22_09635 [Streptococcus pneumoniae]